MAIWWQRTVLVRLRSAQTKCRFGASVQVDMCTHIRTLFEYRRGKPLEAKLLKELQIVIKRHESWS